MLGMRSPLYLQWLYHATQLNELPKGLQVVNTGSTPTYKSFDYVYWNIEGANLGFQSQTLYYDYETLKKYNNNIRKGAKIFIGVEEFKFFVDVYDNESADHKYYLWLDSNQILTYDRKTAWLIKHAPVILHPEFILKGIKRLAKGLLVAIKKHLNHDNNFGHKSSIYTEEDDIMWSKKYADSWNKEFGWECEQKITSKQAQVIAINEKRLSEMIDYCIESGWKPYLIVLPFSPNLTKLLSETILQDGLWKPLERISKEKKIPLLNYYYDKRFADYRLYSDALTFNEAGRRLFNRIIQEQIGMEDGTVVKKEKTYKLRNQVHIPWISYGTGVIWKYTRNPLLFLRVNIRQIFSSLKHMKINRELYGNLHIKRILSDAYETGFRMFDSGRIYAHSEDNIGCVVSEKTDVFITTKCSWMDITRSCSPNNVAGNLSVSLKNIKREKVDLYLLHWPECEWIDVYSQIIDEYQNGRCKAFGACNMSIEDLEAIKDAGLELPMVVQTEIHPLCVKKDLREYCQKNGIQLMAHTPTGHYCKELQESVVLKNLQMKYKKTIIQIIIRWHYQNNIIPVINTFSKMHMKENLDIFNFELTDDEMHAIDSLDKGKVLLTSHGIDDPNYIYNY